MQRDRSKVTIYDVARHAGVAISTVSRVLNESSDVSDRTRSIVKQAIDDLNYTPDRTARTLAQQEFHSVAVALPSFTAPFHNEVLKGIRTALKEGGLDLLISDLGSGNITQRLRQFLKRGAVDALLICGVPIDDTLAAEIASIQAPAVLIGEVHPFFRGYRWNDVAGARDAVTHLVQQGHERIAMIRASTDSRVQNDRVEGYRQALADAGLVANPDLIVPGRIDKHAGFSEEDGYDAMQQILSDLPGVTAVFASSDVQALGAWSAIVESGLRVPDDMALVGYDDIKTSRYLGLSSVDQSMQKIAREATSHLLDELYNRSGSGSRDITTVSPRLNVRRSSQKRRS
ncbi:MAG: LacI family DNA-binding transcriptional regulator [Rhodothermales bacterium]|nr:LacI family DNA-binding transcriptional regulator [Rhodothermales bacterium]